MALLYGKSRWGSLGMHGSCVTDVSKKRCMGLDKTMRTAASTISPGLRSEAEVVALHSMVHVVRDDYTV